jgi:hypothetical protein
MFGSNREPKAMRSAITRRIAARVRTISLLAAALAVFMPGAHAESASGTSGAQASIDFRIVIPVVVRARAQSAPQFLPIDEGDIARGYVELKDATSIVLTSNSTSGYAVSVVFDERVVSRVEVRIQGRTLEAASQGSWLHVDAPRMADVPLRVGYRLFLAAGTRAGTYRWPVALAFGSGA